ncbi:F-BAR and double SH3 domains protein 1-like [Bufo gargarizans]|uniref:F-BAR and double SH3 domains protein 1-like n=1 Tax=Bufo gargarizans TaxID=30331 RepID=UPI001CF15762|nr:F-BAR and double SH3 domains protein 1-like [Bufo gargarizans]
MYLDTYSSIISQTKNGIPALPAVFVNPTQLITSQVLQRLEDRRKNASEEEVLSILQKIEEVKENVRKAEVSKVKADARVELLRHVGVDVDTWLSGAMTQANEELEQERRLSEARMSNGEMSPSMEDFDFSEFDDMDDDGEIFEESPLNLSGNRSYPTPCHVLYNYTASLADELTITQGERLEVIEDGDVEEWVKARNKTGQVGYVPEKYITYMNQGVVESLRAGHIEGLSGAQCLSGILELERSDATVSLARALYDYEGQSEEELTFPEGAIIQIIRRDEGGVDDGFWKGEFNGRVGVFPSLVVEELTGDDPDSQQELPSPGPPPFSPPVFSPLACQRLSTTDTDSRQNGSGSAHSSPDFAATRLRPMRAAPPPPTKGTESPSSDP